MTPSEQLTALAEERANSPDNWKEMLALVIDRSTSAIVSNINYEIGKATRYTRVLSRSSYYVPNNDYEKLLREYVQTKLHLHQLRKSMHYPFDSYAEREGDLRPVLDRCIELRKTIRAMRKDIPGAAWGDLPPIPAKTPYDKPLLHAMDTHDCSYLIYEFEEERACPVQAEHWYHGLPYCRKHFMRARYDAKAERRFKQQQAKARHRAVILSGDWSVERPPTMLCKEPGCLRAKAHVHSFGGVEYV